MFPLDHNTQGWDSALYTPGSEDPVIKTELEGGYAASRPRHTRIPRKHWKLGWRSTSDVNYYILRNFWDQMRGGSNSFTWVDPATITLANPAGTTYTVRFKGEIQYSYAGMGTTKLWDINLELEQV